MNDQTGTAAGARPYELAGLDLRSIPGQSSLFLDFLFDPGKVSRFYPNQNSPLENISRIVVNGHEADRGRLCSMLEAYNSRLGAGSGTLANIARLRSRGTVTVMTGQQAGLFSGPAYTIYKAVSAIRLASELTEKGIDAVPVFWIASEDHDLEEVSRTWIPDGADGIAQIEYAPGLSEGNSRPVGNVAFDDTVTRLVETATEVLEGTGETGPAKLLRDCYSSGATFSDAFGRLILKLLGNRGLVLVSPMEAEFRALAAPIVRKAVENAAAIGEALRGRDAELNASGYHSQVHIGDDFFPFFLIDDDGSRVPLRLAGDDSVQRQDTSESISVADLLERFEENPAILSPNAIMRPVVQDFVFPNVTYFGGSAEVAYFAQNSAVYEVLERPVVPVRHRASFTIIESKNRRTLLSYSKSFKDILKGREAMTGEIKEEFLDPETAEVLRTTRAEIERLIGELQTRLGESEPTLAESLSKRRRKILWHIETIRDKFLKAETFRDEVAARRLAYLFATTFPDDALQERSVNFLYFLGLFGDRLIDWLIESASTEGTEHTILTF